MERRQGFKDDSIVLRVILNSLYVLVATFIQGTPDLCVEQQPPVTLFVSEVS